MRTEGEFDELEQAIDRLPQMIPIMFNKLVPEFELFAGKKLKKQLSTSDLDVIIRNLKRLLSTLKEIEKLRKQELTSRTATQMIRLMNRRIRLFVKGIPRGTEPIDYVMKVTYQMSDVPALVSLPQELDYVEKHRNLCEFVCELVQSPNETKLNNFLQDAVTGHHLVSQFQKVLNKISLPKELQEPDTINSVKDIERLKLGLRGVTADWEGWVNLLYGLVLLKSGLDTTWNKIYKVSLWSKANKVLTEPLLKPLAKLEWITMRNALDHGSAFFDPSRNSIVFQDVRRKVSLGAREAWLEGMDIYLANCAATYIWNFSSLERVKSFERLVDSLRQLAQQG